MVDASAATALERACMEHDPSWMTRRADLDSGGSRGYSADLGYGWEAVVLDGGRTCSISLRLRGGSIEATMNDVMVVEVSRRRGMSAESVFVRFEAPIDGWDYDGGWTMPDPGYGFWNALLRMLLGDREAMASGASASTDGMRISMRPYVYPNGEVSDGNNIIVGMEARGDGAVLWRLELDGYLGEDADGMPCMRTFDELSMRFDVPDYARGRFARENPLPDGAEWMHEHQWRGFPSGVTALRGGIEDALRRLRGPVSRGQ